jgi:hypothetical protein
VNASTLIKNIEHLIEKYGDHEVLVDVTSESQVFGLRPTIDYDQFIPKGKHCFVLETEWYEA